MGMSSLLGKLGKSIDEGIDKVKDTVEDVTDKVKSNKPEYFAESFETMQEVADCLNGLTVENGIKDFEVIDIESTSIGQLEVLLKITKA